MDLKGTIVTSDALNCQKDTVSEIAGSKGDYVLALKVNQPLFYEEVQEFLMKKKEVIPKSRNGYKKTVEKEHGGVALYHGRCGLVCRQKAVEKLKAFGMIRL